MSKSALEARYIRPQQIRIGDVLKVSWKEHDVNLSCVAKIAKKEVNNSGSYFLSAGNFSVLFMDRRGVAYALMGLDNRAFAKIIRLNAGDSTAVALDGI